MLAICVATILPGNDLRAAGEGQGGAADWKTAGAAATASGSAPQAVSSSAPATESPQASAASRQAEKAEEIFAQSRQLLDRADSISARIRNQAELLDHPIRGTGLYLQQGHGPRRLTRMELRSQAEGEATTFLEICDGHILWSLHASEVAVRPAAPPPAGQQSQTPAAAAPAAPSLSKVDLDRVWQAWEQTANEGRLDAARFPTVAGLPKLLDGIRHKFHFTRATEGRLGDVAVWTVEGRWRADELAAAVPDQRAAILAGRPIDLKKFPKQLPERILLDIGRDDQVPYRIRYLRRGGNSGSGGGAGEGGSSEADDGNRLPAGYHVIVSMELFEVRLGGPIDPRQFIYQPSSGLQVLDATEGYLKALHLSTPPK